MSNIEMSNDFIDKAFELVVKKNSIDDNLDNTDFRLEQLANLITEILSGNENILYFTLPMWDYSKNTWLMPPYHHPVGRFSLDNGKKWEEYKDLSITTENEDSVLAKYLKFRNELKSFSFSDFFTNHVIDLKLGYKISFNNSKGANFVDDDLFPKFSFNENVSDVDFINLVKNFAEGDDDYILKFKNFLANHPIYFPGIKEIYFTPSLLFMAKKRGGYTSSGGLIMVSKGEDAIDGKTWEQLSVLVNICYRECGGRNIHSVQKRESIKSAIAAIMSRNMSHNLGSHFISKTKYYFAAKADTADNSKDIQDYRGIEHTLQYIQERMDFIATLASSNKFPFGAVNAKSQIFDELTVDDFGKRHNKNTTNFLMDFIVMSENLSKHSSGINDNAKDLSFRFGFEENGEYEYWNPKSLDVKKNDNRRDKLAQLNFAIPGGILGRHAVFSIIENIIRNAAKYNQEYIPSTGLQMSLLITKDDYLLIYDNKNDAKIDNTVNDLNERMNSIHIVNEANQLDNGNKGLKEILICSIWLQNDSVDAVLSQSTNTKNKYVRILKVNEKGVESEDGKFLAYKIKLAKFVPVFYIDGEIAENINYKETGNGSIMGSISSDVVKNIKADIICAEKDYFIDGTQTKLSDVFPRFYKVENTEISVDQNNKKRLNTSDKIIFESILQGKDGNRFGETVSDTIMAITDDAFPKDTSSKVQYFHDAVPAASCFEETQDVFLFQNHAGKTELSKYNALYNIPGFENRYVDSISGGDFTHTLVQPSFAKIEYNRLKIIESVKTKIVIIDERLFERHCTNPPKSIATFNPRIQCGCENKTIEQRYLERRGIYIYSFVTMDNSPMSMVDLTKDQVGHLSKDSEEKINFSPSKSFSAECSKFFPYNEGVIFLTIHLGLIDKLAESLNLRDGEDKIVEALKTQFNAKFVSVHSGRGGADVKKSLEKYLFQSFSSVEAPFNDSKYLLTQQFYSQAYYGKVNYYND